MIIWTLIEIIG